MLTKEEEEFIDNIVDLYGDILEKYCLRRLSGIPDRYQTAQDIVQSVYLEALKKVDELMGHPSVLRWLKKVCGYRISEELRERKRRPMVATPAEQVQQRLDREQLMKGIWRWEQTHLSEVIEAVADILTQEEQDVFESVFLEGNTMKETAEKKNMRFGVVRSKVNAIRRKLNKFFGLMCILALLVKYIK